MDKRINAQGVDMTKPMKVVSRDFPAATEPDHPFQPGSDPDTGTPEPNVCGHPTGRGLQCGRPPEAHALAAPAVTETDLRDRIVDLVWKARELDDPNAVVDDLYALAAPAVTETDHEPWCYRRHTGDCVDGPGVPPAPAVTETEATWHDDGFCCPSCGHDLPRGAYTHRCAPAVTETADLAPGWGSECTCDGDGGHHPYCNLAKLPAVTETALLADLTERWHVVTLGLRMMQDAFDALPNLVPAATETAHDHTADCGCLPIRVVIDQHGHYWRDYGDHWSMCPVSTENVATEPVTEFYRFGEGGDFGSTDTEEGS